MCLLHNIVFLKWAGIMGALAFQENAHLRFLPNFVRFLILFCRAIFFWPTRNSNTFLFVLIVNNNTYSNSPYYKSGPVAENELLFGPRALAPH